MLALGACSSVTTGLQRAQVLYREARYEEVLDWLHSLQPDIHDMSPRQQARFFYLRGMAAYRLGERDDARHYLALAAVLLDEDRDRLPAPWRPVMQRALHELAQAPGPPTQG
ncbi:MAG: hypothetical protein OEZ06_08245 [Myxococcales bacterium]|nr:hypothetical protein [Myxococcales bacterium]